MSVYIDKQKENSGIELDKNCPVTPWIYIIKFTSGGQGTGQYVVYKSPLVTLNGLKNDEQSPSFFQALKLRLFCREA